MEDELLLSADEIQLLTGGYKRPGAQLAELHRLGFHRARRAVVTGGVVLERAHYLAVCAGAVKALSTPTVRPVLRLPQAR